MNEFEFQNLIIVLYVLTSVLVGVFYHGSFNAKFAVAVLFPVFLIRALVLGILELFGATKNFSSK